MRLMQITAKRKILILTLISAAAVFCLYLLLQYQRNKETVTMVMGGRFYKQVTVDGSNIISDMKPDIEKYFRPSKLPALNDRFTWRFFDPYLGKKTSEISIPDKLVSTPEDTVINYFSILREAVNFQPGKEAGCGSIGYGDQPYPVTYNFLSSAYQNKLSFEQYKKTFQNIYHISLIKYRQVPLYDNTENIIRYFVELETIEGTEKGTAVFGYYYGYIDMIKEKGQYKITNQEFHGEDFLCAPYHGWYHDALANVQIRYGGWCSMIKEMYPVMQRDYVLNISFAGNDGKDYLIVFYKLTNDTDIEIAQYVKEKSGSWQLTKLEPEKRIKD